MAGSLVALVQLFWHIRRSGVSSFGWVFGSHKPTGCSGVKAPDGIPFCKREAMSASGSWDRVKRVWNSFKRKGWNLGIVESIWLEGKQDCKSCKKGRISSSVMKGFGWWLRHACTKWECKWLLRMRATHLFRTSLKISCGVGIVQFALLLPAPSVIHGPRLMGLFVRRVFHWVRSWLNDDDWETHGRMISILAEANFEGYSAVSALMKDPSGSRLPRMSKWLQCVQCPASDWILSDVAAIAQVLYQASPHLQAGVATKKQGHCERNCWWSVSHHAKELMGCSLAAKPPCWNTAVLIPWA